MQFIEKEEAVQQLAVSFVKKTVNSLGTNDKKVSGIVYGTKKESMTN